MITRFHVAARRWLAPARKVELGTAALGCMLAVCLFAFAGSSAHAGTLTVLHDFADGAEPKGSLTLSGSTLYGMTRTGGDYSYGTIFKVGIDGSDYTLLHEFAGGVDDGGTPGGSLALSGSTLYGMTISGGDNNRGTVFSVGTDGSEFSLLHEFAGGDGDGEYPYDNLTLSGSTLYGMTHTGGESDKGTVFKLGTNGSSFSLLHEFAGGGDDGDRPRGSLVLSDSTLYGATTYGGNDNQGVVFSIGTDGGGFSLVHELSGTEGAYPAKTALTLSGSTLYGLASNGGDGNNYGTAFSVGTGGSGFTVLHDFAGGAADGGYPEGVLAPGDLFMYGMTPWGGDLNEGTVYAVSPDGSGYFLLHEFVGSTDGKRPYGSLTLSGTTLYGMTSSGGANNKGTIFALDTTPIPEPMSMIFFGTGVVGVFGFVARRKMQNGR